MTYDVCYHPTTLGRAMESAAFLKMLVNTTLDGVDAAWKKLHPEDKDGAVDRRKMDKRTGTICPFPS
jgi:hypothetical protein